MGDSAGELVRQELELARDALQDARLLLTADGTASGVLNRLYYAVFHGAQAVLYARGVSATSHGQVRQQFGQHVVLEGDATREDGRLLGTLYDYRREADYSGSLPDVELERLLAEVETFVDRMATLIGTEVGNGH